MVFPVDGNYLRAAERLEVQFEGMSIPIPIDDLVNLGIRDGNISTELSSWLNLLDDDSKAGLVKLLKAPLFTDRSMARQILRSWVGRKLLDEMSDFIRLDEDRTGNKVFTTLELLLDEQQQVSTIDLLKGLPAKNIKLDLDALVKLASSLRKELQKQEKILLALSKYPLSPEKNKKTFYIENASETSLSTFFLKVDHRPKALSLEIWEPSDLTLPRSNWVVFMPGLGGSPYHFRWLAERLSNEGWPVVVLEHPGSDDKAIQALLEGARPVPGGEILKERLGDLNAVLAAKERGELKVKGKKIVIMGHSLGALTALFAAGAVPEEGLKNRCERALNDLSLTNLSKLLQCQLIDMNFEKQTQNAQIEAIIAINSFGSLLWPEASDASIPFPVFLIGGTFDLITPAISEQLGLLLSLKANQYHRALIVQGASHFSPVRVEGQLNQEKGGDLFQLGESLVGLKPVLVQDTLASEIIKYLNKLESGVAIPSSIHKKNSDIRFHILDRSNVQRLLGS